MVTEIREERGAYTQHAVFILVKQGMRGLGTILDGFIHKEGSGEADIDSEGVCSAKDMVRVQTDVLYGTVIRISGGEWKSVANLLSLTRTIQHPEVDGELSNISFIILLCTPVSPASLASPSSVPFKGPPPSLPTPVPAVVHRRRSCP